MDEKGRFYLTLILTISLFVGVIFYLQFLGNRMVQTEAPLIEACIKIKLELTRAHLTQEQAISAESNVHIEDIDYHLHRALWFVGVMLRGGENEDGKFVPLENAELKVTIAGVENDLLRLEEVSHRYLEAGYVFKQSDAVDKAFDSTFESTMLHIDLIEKKLKVAINVLKEKMTGIGFIVGTLLLGFITLLHFFNFQKSESLFKDKLNKLSMTDGLTGLGNRRRFDAFLSQEWARALRDRKPLSIIFCDIDFFKNFNDALGHLAGDECLKSVAKVLKDALVRSVDDVARYGGEEFCITLPSTHSDGAVLVMHQISIALAAEKIEHPDSTVSAYVTISSGIATVVPNSGLNMDGLLLAADQALYAAKEKGRNQLVSVNLPS